MAHNFWKSLDYENSKAHIADSFYYNQFKVENIERFNSGSDLDMVFQKKDIDVQLEGWGKHANVSEKFREIDFNDLYLELYSMYPNTKGWMNKSEADYLAYFFPKRMLWIKENELQKIYNQFVEPTLNKNELELWLDKNQNKSGKYKTKIEVDNSLYEVLIIIAYNKTNNKNWNTVGVSVPFNLLKNCGLSWKEYKL